MKTVPSFSVVQSKEFPFRVIFLSFFFVACVLLKKYNLSSM